MDAFAGLDVSVQETALCVVDGEGNVLLETTVTTDPQRIAQALASYQASLRRVGHEAGALSPWLHPALQALGLPVTCLEARRVHGALPISCARAGTARRTSSRRARTGCGCC